MKFVRDSLLSKNAWQRALTGIAVGNLLMYGVWAGAFAWLPEGLLRGKTGAGSIGAWMVESSVLVLALQIFMFNGVIAYVVVPVVGKIAVGRLSLGYVLALGNWVLFGIFLGTNSFSNPSPAPRPPGIQVFLGTGPWEISAYTLVAAALAHRYRIRQFSWFSSKSERVAGRFPALTIAERMLLLASSVILLATAWVEAAKIVARH